MIEAPDQILPILFNEYKNTQGHNQKNKWILMQWPLFWVSKWSSSKLDLNQVTRKIQRWWLNMCHIIINKWNCEFFKRNPAFCKGSICLHTTRMIQLDRFDYLYYKHYRSVSSQDVLLDKHIDVCIMDGKHYQEYIVKKAISKDFFILISTSNIGSKYWLCKLRGTNRLKWMYTKFKF